MKIVVSFKVVPDDQDIQVSGDGSLDYAKAHQIVSTYDLNAMEAAAQLAAANEGSEVVGITVGGKKIRTTPRPRRTCLLAALISST